MFLLLVVWYFSETTCSIIRCTLVTNSIWSSRFFETTYNLLCVKTEYSYNIYIYIYYRLVIHGNSNIKYRVQQFRFLHPGLSFILLLPVLNFMAVDSSLVDLLSLALHHRSFFFLQKIKSYGKLIAVNRICQEIDKLKDP